MHRRKNVLTKKCSDEKMYRRKNAGRKKVGRKSVDEKLSDENLLDEKMSWNPEVMVNRGDIHANQMRYVDFGD